MGDDINALVNEAFLSYGETYRFTSFDNVLMALYRYTCPMTRNVYGIRDPDQQKEVFQESALRFFKYLRTYDRQRPFLPWWEGIVRSAALDFIKKNGIRQSREYSTDDERLLDNSLIVWKRAEQSERKIILEDVLSRLHPHDREILWMHYVHGLTAEEISKLVNKSLFRTKYAIHRALKKLRNLFQSGPAAPKKANPERGKKAPGNAVS
ncbi:MAG TPA: sigma-70 family RNA polymerase sigma factor [Bryobacteraceae bacterium]|nr:sigma-70 family RNA polymerase sigma factor [Bryobacteraceae bacterium]